MLCGFAVLPFAHAAFAARKPLPLLGDLDPARPARPPRLALDLL
jgi:hypothetical protein